MSEFINDMNGTGYPNEDDDLSGFVNELENLMCEEVEISQHTDGSVSFSTFGEVPYSWRETFNEILKKNFIDVSVNVNVEEESPLKIDLRNGELNEIPGETLVYYPGYEEDFIEMLPQEVINKIRRQQDE